jgi:hypothetical protein
MTQLRRASTMVVVMVALSACGGGSPDRASTGPSRSPTRASPPALLGTEALQRWTSAWTGSFQQFADDLSAVIAAIRSRDAGSLREALGRLPGDAREAAAKIGEAGPPPPGLTDEANHLRGLVGRAAGLGPNLSNDCTGQAGLACAADAATLLSVVGQILDALRPFGVHIRFHIDL